MLLLKNHCTYEGRILFFIKKNVEIDSIFIKDHCTRNVKINANAFYTVLILICSTNSGATEGVEIPKTFYMFGKKSLKYISERTAILQFVVHILYYMSTQVWNKY